MNNTTTLYYNGSITPSADLGGIQNEEVLSEVASTTASPQGVPLWSKTLTGLSLAIVILLTVGGNAVVIMAYVTEKKMRTNFGMYVVNLAFTDFMVGLTGMTVYLIDYMLGYWPFGEVS